MRDALAAFRARAFVCLRQPSYFLFACSKRKITKEKEHPAWRLPGILPGKSVRRGRAFRSGIGQLLLRCLNSGIHAVACPSEKASTSLSTARCAASRPRLTAAQGPRAKQRAILARTRWKAEKLKSNNSINSINSNSEGNSGDENGREGWLLCSAFDLAFLKSARRERAALPGAPMARRVGGGKPAGWPAWMPASFSRSTGCRCRKTP